MFKKKTAKIVSFALVLAMVLTAMPGMFAGAMTVVPANPTITFDPTVIPAVPYTLANVQGGYFRSSAAQGTVPFGGDWMRDYNNATDSAQIYFNWSDGLTNPDAIMRFVLEDGNGTEYLLRSRRAAFSWDSVREWGGAVQQNTFIGDVRVIEVDCIASIYRGDHNVFGGFRLYNTPGYGLSNFGIPGTAGPENTYFMFPFGTAGVEIEIVAPGNAFFGSTGGTGYVGITYTSWNSQLNFVNMDPWGNVMRNPVAVGGHPQFTRDSSAPIFVRQSFTFEGVEVDTWFMIIQRDTAPVAPTAPASIGSMNTTTWLNGFSIPSWNIAGETYVHEHWLASYGFDLAFCQVRNRLDVTARPANFMTPFSSPTQDLLNKQTAAMTALNATNASTVTQTVRVEVGTLWERNEVAARMLPNGGGMLINVLDLGALSAFTGPQNSVQVWSFYPILNDNSIVCPVDGSVHFINGVPGSGV
jgi:hypothetical protein